jgi:hypothetical protein
MPPRQEFPQTYRDPCIAELMVSVCQQAGRWKRQLSSKARVFSQCSSALPSGQPSRSHNA